MNRLLTLACRAMLVVGLAPAAAAAVTCGGRNATQVGDNVANTIHGTDEMDVIVSYDGGDTVYGYASGDRACLGAGNDWAAGRAHGLRVGRQGRRPIYGRGRFDELHGQVGNDTLIGGGGVDDLYGEGGADHLIGTGTEDNFVWNEDYLNGEPGNDVLDARGGVYNVLVGGTGYDVCYANGGPEPDGIRGCEEIHWSLPGTRRMDPCLNRAHRLPVGAAGLEPAASAL